MSVRPIEVQGSFPHSQKTGKLQDQMQQRGQVGQNIIAQNEKEAELLKKMQVNQSNESEKAQFLHDEQQEQQEQEKQQKKQLEEKKQKLAKHPHKGKFIDFSG